MLAVLVADALWKKPGFTSGEHSTPPKGPFSWGIRRHYPTKRVPSARFASLAAPLIPLATAAPQSLRAFPRTALASPGSPPAATIVTCVPDRSSTGFHQKTPIWHTNGRRGGGVPGAIRIAAESCASRDGAFRRARLLLYGGYGNRVGEPSASPGHSWLNAAGRAHSAFVACPTTALAIYRGEPAVVMNWRLLIRIEG